MPFGLMNALATFQVFINNILREHLDIFIIIYLDNVLIYSENKKDYKEYVRTVLELFNKVKL